MINVHRTLLLRRCCHQGFTFIEILAAMLFMAIVIPAAVKGIMIANRAGVAAERKRVAVQLADTKLTEILLSSEIIDNEQEGEFTEEQIGDNTLNYWWEVQTYTWKYDTMQVIEVTVFYNVQGEVHSVTLSTLEPEAEDES